MKKLLHIVLLSTLFCSFTARTSAKVADVTELYGEWTYTATVSYADGVTEAQKANIKETGTAIISQPSVPGYGCEVTEFLGIKNPFLCLFSANTLTCRNPNSANMFSIGSWALSDGATKNPWGNFSDWEWTVSEDGKTITISTFYIVSCGYQDPTAKLIATVTDATFTFSKAEEVEAIDLTGDWKFTATQYCGEWTERFPHEFDMKLTAKDQTYKTYDATLDFGEEYTEQTFNDVTFNGVTVTIPLGSSKRYLNDSLSLAQMSENNILFDGVITFNKTDSRTLSLTSRLDIRMDTTVVDDQQASHETTKYIQYYIGGTAKKAVSYSFEGTYVVTVDDEGLMRDNNTSGFEYPKNFEFTIISKDGRLTFSNFMGCDFTNPPYSGSVALSADNPYVLELGIGIDGYTYNSVYTFSSGKALYLHDGNGETKNPVTITYNEEDGTLSISDFSFAYYDFIGGQGLVGVEAYYTNATIVKKGEEAPEKWDYFGDYTMTATISKEAAAADYADFDFAESSKFTLFEAPAGEITLPYVTFFMGIDLGPLNYGGFRATADEDAKTISFTGACLYNNREAGKQLNLRDATGGMNPIVVTYNEDGTITMSDFTIVDIEGNRVAACTGVTLTRGYTPEPGAIESVSSDRKAAVYAADGVIYIAGEPTRVEVYSISGAQEYSGITNEIGGLNRGFYLVKANGSTSKVIVR